MCKDVHWCWLPIHGEAVSKLKQMICKAPVLKYFDRTKVITLRCDASESGLGFSLLQEGQPVAYGAHGLTLAEKNCAQIEKEMLAIVVGCEKFNSISVATKHMSKQTISHWCQFLRNQFI